MRMDLTQGTRRLCWPLIYKDVHISSHFKAFHFRASRKWITNALQSRITLFPHSLCGLGKKSSKSVFNTHYGFRYSNRLKKIDAIKHKSRFRRKGTLYKIRNITFESRNYIILHKKYLAFRVTQ